VRQVRVEEDHIMPSQKTLDDFVALVVSGKHDEALERFYTEDATMQDNLGDVRKGRDGLVARERAFMGRFKEIRTTCVKPVFVSGGSCGRPLDLRICARRWRRYADRGTGPPAVAG
jgi:hypothetical protein